MQKRMTMAWVGGLVLLMVGGCGNWKQKYDLCNSELENAEGLLAMLGDERDRLQSQFDQANMSLVACQSEQHNAVIGSANPFPGEDVTIGPGTITVTMPDQVLFDSGQVALKSGSKGRLSRIAGTISSNYGGNLISVVGHTDRDPIRKSKWKDNWELSSQRALAVTRYLVNQGIPAKQMEAVGRGEHHSLGTKAQSRRVEIVVHTF